MVDPKDHIQTNNAINSRQQTWMDLGLVDATHSTCTAGKAVGAGYGTSKQAKLVIVQIAILDGQEINEAIEKIIDDISTKPDRQKKSVVTMSLTGTPPSTDPARQAVQASTKKHIKTLMDMDVPFFVPAGNDAPTIPNVDTVPATYASDDYPLFVIGSTTVDGRISTFSQTSDEVFLHAPGEGITCLPPAGNQPLQPPNGPFGTSFATPLVAGEVANLLSYDQVPFDTSTGNLVKNLRKYLQDDASWSRTKDSNNKDVPMIWNGVTEKDNPKTQPPTSPPPPPSPALACNGINNVKWMAKDAIASKVSTFCADAAKQGVQDHDSASILRNYDGGTVNDLDLSMDWPSGATFRPSEPDCNEYMKQIITSREIFSSFLIFILI
jgi:subtilisin family serine protease